MVPEMGYPIKILSNFLCRNINTITKIFVKKNLHTIFVTGLVDAEGFCKNGIDKIKIKIKIGSLPLLNLYIFQIN